MTENVDKAADKAADTAVATAVDTAVAKADGSVRVRFPPSPTGDPHVGMVR